MSVLACAEEPSPTDPQGAAAPPAGVVSSDKPAPADGNSPGEAEAQAPSPWQAEGLDALRPDPRLVWPTQVVHLTSQFGWRTDPVAGAGLRLHRGIDLRGARGDLVMSLAPGRVRFAGRDPALGNLVIVDHPGGLSSWYGHLSSISVHAGLRVQGGTAIGAVGNTGRSAAPHLHLTMKKRAEGSAPDSELAVDPLAWLG